MECQSTHRQRCQTARAFDQPRVSHNDASQCRGAAGARCQNHARQVRPRARSLSAPIRTQVRQKGKKKGNATASVVATAAQSGGARHGAASVTAGRVHTRCCVTPRAERRDARTPCQLDCSPIAAPQIQWNQTCIKNAIDAIAMMLCSTVLSAAWLVCLNAQRFSPSKSMHSRSELAHVPAACRSSEILFAARRHDLSTYTSATRRSHLAVRV